jgi:hypothetical protein
MMLFRGGGHGRLKFVGAGHVSENSNTYDRALQAVRDSWNSTRHVPHFFVANQKESTECFSL